jgi:hypothetical protein
MNMKWQYLRAQFLTTGKDRDEEQFEQYLEDRGQEGWELVSVLEKTVDGPDELGKGDWHTLYFKRPR